MNVFIGVDRRQPIAAQVLAHSIYTRSSKPVSITPLVLSQLPIKRRGLTEFTFSRYLVPWLSNFVGRSIFLDADMLCLGDIAELEDLADPIAPVSLVKNKVRFEWPSMMVFNNAACTHLTPAFIDDPQSQPQSFRWAKEVVELPPDWNFLCGYDKYVPNVKLVHYTSGVPIWPETKHCDYAQEWQDERKASNSSVSFDELMGKSVHAQRMA